MGANMMRLCCCGGGSQELNDSGSAILDVIGGLWECYQDPEVEIGPRYYTFRYYDPGTDTASAKCPDVSWFDDPCAPYSAGGSYPHTLRYTGLVEWNPNYPYAVNVSVTLSGYLNTLGNDYFTPPQYTLSLPDGTERTGQSVITGSWCGNTLVYQTYNGIWQRGSGVASVGFSFRAPIGTGQVFSPRPRKATTWQLRVLLNDV